jgi:plasmid stabilization system protein ParE
MPSLSVDIHPEAIAEAQAATQWYRERSPSAAAAYLAELDLAVAAIAENPEMWPRYAHGTRRYILHRFPFSLVKENIEKLPAGLKSSLWPMADENLDTGNPG